MNIYDSSLDFSTAFKIGPIYVSWYGIFITLGFLMFMFFSYIEWKKKGYDNFDFYTLFLVGSFVSLLGARIWYLIFNPSDIQGFVSFFSISSGRSILGSLFFGYLWLYYYTNRHASYIETRYAVSIIIPNILLAQAIGRWGNFFQQDVYGNVMVKPGMFPAFIMNNMYIDGAYRQPMFLYESILDLFGWILITFWIKNLKKIKPGVHAGMYFFWYGSLRASLELFRDDKYIMHIGNIPTSFILAICFAIFGILMIIYYQFYYVKFNVWLHFYGKEKKKQIKSNSRNFLKLLNLKNLFHLKILWKEYNEKKWLNYVLYLEYCLKVKQKRINAYIKRIDLKYIENQKIKF